jgi:hypothetical protein
MIVLKVQLVGFADNAQTSGDGGLAGRENGSAEQPFDMREDRL